VTRESFVTAEGKQLERLLIGDQKLAVVAAVSEPFARLLIEYYGWQWKWWALVGGVMNSCWLVRDAEAGERPLVLERGDQPIVLRSSFDGLTQLTMSRVKPKPGPRVRVRRR
jgi:hypothetical protein